MLVMIFMLRNIISFLINLFFYFQVKHGTTEEDVSYAGAQVWRTSLRSAQDAQAIKSLADQQAISLWKLNSDFADFLIQATHQVKVNRVLRAHRLQSTSVIVDVQRTLDQLRPTPSLWNDNALRNGYRLNWECFPTLTVIDEYLQHLAKMFPSLCKLSTIGLTYEKRPIKMLRISNGNPKNKAIMMTAGIHAREWAAITSALYLLDTIVMNFDRLPNYMKNVDWTIIPVLNPDGYEYSYTKDRLWRKNRQKTQNPNCLGVDINRNFGYQWHIPNVTNINNACGEDYSGNHAFSAEEAVAMRNLIGASEKLPDAFIDVHTYGQIILYPWMSKPGSTKDNEHLKTIARVMALDIQNTTGKKYFFGDGYNMMYQCPGSQIDWLYSLGVSTVYAFETRDNFDVPKLVNGKGFLLPPEQIEPCACDLLAAMRQLAEIIATSKQKTPKTGHNLGIRSFLNYTIEKVVKFIGK